MTLSNLIELETDKTSQVDLARRTGVSQSTVSAWQSGLSLPPSTRLPSLALALGIPLADLTAMVARERKARGRRRGAVMKVVGCRGHGQVSCPQRTPRPARRPGQVRP